MLWIRRVAAAAVLCAVVLATGACGLTSPKPDPDNEALEATVAAFVDAVGRGEYASAQGMLCPDGRADHTEASLRTEFEPHPRPWTRFVTATSRSDRSGHLNLDLTPGGQPVVRYTFDLERVDGGWRLCDVTRGSFQVDVG